MITIPQFSLTAQNALLRKQIDEAIARVVSSGRFILGSETEAFEQEWAAYCGAKHCVAVSSGTMALTAAIRASGYEDARGHAAMDLDTISLPALTFVATAEAIVNAGRKPHFMDINKGLFLGPVEHCDVAVALYGEPIDIPYNPAPDGGSHRIADMCQAHGSHCIDWSEWWAAFYIACYSFYPGKNLGTVGDGGAIVTNDAAVAARCRSLRNHGIDLAKGTTDPVHVEAGWNARMGEIQAAVLRVKLPHLDTWNGARRTRAAYYRNLLDGVDGITLPADTLGHVYHQFVIRVMDGKRDALKAWLATREIETRIHYARTVPMQPAFRPYILGAHVERPTAYWPNALRACSEVLSLPMYSDLPMSDVEKVAQAIKEWSRR